MDDDVWSIAVRRTKSTARQLNITFNCAPEPGRLKRTSAEYQTGVMYEQKGQSKVIKQNHSDSDAGSDTAADNDPLGMARKFDISRCPDRLYPSAVGLERPET